METLKAIKERYVQEKGDEIIQNMIERGYINYKVSTCDHYNSDRKYHELFPDIANYLRGKGFKVTSNVKFGVTDWTIVVK